MNFQVVYLSSRSVTIEMEGCSPYFYNENYSVFVNGILYESNVKTNIFSIFNLCPSTSYSISIKTSMEEIIKKIKTKFEFVKLNVRKFGAKGDGVSDDTKFIQAAILSCPDNGLVYIPSGKYHIGPLFLKSNITIELAKDSILIGDIDRNNYPILPGIIMADDEINEYNLGTWEGNPLDSFASIITGINIENVKIIGQGVIDCNAQNSDWWDNHNVKRIAWRPRGIFLNNCKNVSVQGIQICNTASWCLHPYFSTDIDFIDLKIISPKVSPNTDGCNPESCDKVNIIGVHFSVGDDCIAIKAGKIYMGKKYKRASSNFNIRNCSMNFGHGAVVLGSEMSGGIKNIHVSQCIFNETDRGLRIKTRRGRGSDAVIDGIKFENIKMINVLTPLCINMFYFCDPDGLSEYVYTKNALPVDDRTPYLGTFYFKDIKCTNVNVAAGFFYGLPEQKIKRICLENVTFNYSNSPIAGVPVMMSFLEPMKGKGLVFNNVEEVSLTNVKFDGVISEEIETYSVDSFFKE